MELVLVRIAKRKAYTIGRLSIVERIDDEYLAGSKEAYLCDTLEPPVVEMKTTVSMESVLRSPTKAQKLTCIFHNSCPSSTCLCVWDEKRLFI